MKETWRPLPLPNCEGYYVSDQGRVKGPRRMLKGVPDKDGYLTICLAHRGHSVKKIHRLVALTFVPNPKGYVEVNHKDGRKTSNAASNLEWCDRSKNIGHAFEKELRNHRGSNHPNTHLTETDVLEIRESTLPYKELAAAYGISRCTISHIRTGRTWTHV